MRTRLAVILAVLSLCWMGASPAAAAEPSLDDRIEQILAEFPGGIRTSPTTIEWSRGAVVLTLESSGMIAPPAVGNCATGSYCAYTGTSGSGSKLSFTTCNTTVSTAALPGVVRSVANARTSGTVKALNSAGTTLATVSAGGLTNTGLGVTSLRCDA